MSRTLVTVIYASFYLLAVGLWTAVLVQAAEGMDAIAWPAWIQAIGSVLAILAAIWISRRQFRQSHRLAKAQWDREQGIRHLRAHSLAHAIFPDLIEVDVKITASEAAIGRQVEQRNPLNSPQFTTQGFEIVIPVGFKSDGELFYLLGTDTAPCVSELLSLLHQHNGAAGTLIDELKGKTTSAHAWEMLQKKVLFTNRFQLMKKDVEKALDLVGKIRDKELLPEYILEAKHAQ